MSKYSRIAPTDSSALIHHFGSTYKYIKPGCEVLDVGCSSGYYAGILKNDKDCIVDGIEIDDSDRAKAAKILRSVYNFDLDDDDWPSKLTKSRYDVIFLGDVIEHVKNASFVLNKLKVMLKKNGYIIISTPNITHITTRLELLGGNFEYETTGILDETHLKYFTLNTLKQLASNTGLSIVEIDYSLADLMPDLIDNYLNKLGLTPSERFWKMVDKPEARAYQYKLVLRIQRPGDSKIVVKLPNKPLEDRSWFLGQIASFSKEREQHIKRNSELEKSMSELNARDESIRHHLKKTRKLLLKKMFKK